MLRRRAWLAAGVALPLAGCGFRLRDSEPNLPFRSLRLDAPSPPSEVVASLIGRLQGSGVRVLHGGTPPASPPGEVPEVILQVLQDQRERAVVGSTATGQVRELQLRHRLRFSLRTSSGRQLIAPIEVLQERDLSFNETQVLGKEMEEALLYQDMQASVVRQVMYRLAALKGL